MMQESPKLSNMNQNQSNCETFTLNSHHRNQKPIVDIQWYHCTGTHEHLQNGFYQQRREHRLANSMNNNPQTSMLQIMKHEFTVKQMKMHCSVWRQQLRITFHLPHYQNKTLFFKMYLFILFFHTNWILPCQQQPLSIRQGRPCTVFTHFLESYWKTQQTAP